MPPTVSVLQGSPASNKRKARNAGSVLLISAIAGTKIVNGMFVADLQKVGDIMKPEDRGPPCGRPRTSDKYEFAPEPKDTLCGCLE